tara:strand:- start:9021 stop:9431 length:411 start_codon:yes stop_codon:yes gene_type:complete
MSQGDYLRRKRVANMLRIDESEHPVYDSSKFLQFKQFQLENEITTTSIDYSNITAPNNQMIFGMDRDVTNCPTFILCSGTSLRPNRVPLTGKKFNDYQLTWHQKNAMDNSKELWCKCDLNKSTTDENRCACVTNKN